MLDDSTVTASETERNTLMVMKMRRVALSAVALLALLLTAELHAQDASRPSQQQAQGSRTRDRAAASPSSSPVPTTEASTEFRKLPPDSTTKHTLALAGRTLNFTATAGTIRLYTEKGEPQADIAVTAYQLDGADAATRPVTFFFNGGPGASSAWLQFGAAGPWRLNMGGQPLSPSASAEVLPNEQTWLDFTDLVFVDPVGTGYSRFVATGDDVRRHFYSVDGDVSTLALTVRRWLEKADRLRSPKYIVGESYGGIRGPRIARNLQADQGIGIKGLILVSPLFDYRDFTGSSLLQYAYRLPTMAAIAREAKRTPGQADVTRADMADAETYATTDYVADLIKGEADTEATTRLADKVAAMTGLDVAVSRRLAGRLDAGEFRREFDRKDGKVIGRYDGSVSGFDPFPDSSTSGAGDPSLQPLLAPLTTAAVDTYQHKLNWRAEGSYEVLNGAVGNAWDFGRDRSGTESLTQLRQILAADPAMKLLVAHGLFDLATPYFGSKVALDQLPPTYARDRIKLVVYPGGHMFYTRDAPRQALRSEAEALIK